MKHEHFLIELMMQKEPLRIEDYILSDIDQVLYQEYIKLNDRTKLGSFGRRITVYDALENTRERGFECCH